MTTTLDPERQSCAEIIEGAWHVDELSGQAPRLECRGTVLRYIVSHHTRTGWAAHVQLSSPCDRDGVKQFSARATNHDSPSEALQALADEYGEAIDALFGSRHPAQRGDV